MGYEAWQGTAWQGRAGHGLPQGLAVLGRAGLGSLVARLGKSGLGAAWRGKARQGIPQGLAVRGMAGPGEAGLGKVGTTVRAARGNSGGLFFGEFDERKIIM